LTWIKLRTQQVRMMFLLTGISSSSSPKRWALKRGASRAFF